MTTGRVAMVLGVLRLVLGALACSSDDQPASRERMVFDLSLELRYQATVEVMREDAHLEVTFVPQAGFDLLETGRRYDGVGRVEGFPEAEARLYTAELDGPAVPSGPCGSRPVSLALSLSRRGEDLAVSGGLAAYCGQGVTTGSPERIFRLAGRIRSR